MYDVTVEHNVAATMGVSRDDDLDEVGEADGRNQ